MHNVSPQFFKEGKKPCFCSTVDQALLYLYMVSGQLTQSYFYILTDRIFPFRGFLNQVLNHKWRSGFKQH